MVDLGRRFCRGQQVSAQLPTFCVPEYISLQPVFLPVKLASLPLPQGHCEHQSTGVNMHCTPHVPEGLLASEHRCEHAMHTTRPRSNRTLASEGKEQGGRGQMGRQSDSLGLGGCRGTPFPDLDIPHLQGGIRKQGTISHSQESYEGHTHPRGLSIPYTDKDIYTLAHRQYQRTAGAQMGTRQGSCITAQNLWARGTQHWETEQLHTGDFQLSVVTRV